METAPLKLFATWARTALIREVTARIAVVLAPASPERVEQHKAVEALEKAITAAGGDDKGHAAVADRVAYTWFNRIIALRFMDANAYTGVGVVSPQAGVVTGQPGVLAEAKRGNIDAAAVGTETRETVTALLNGTRRSNDAQGEAYALLLTDYCRYWNRAMPFMFEREGDFTELLIPANLLAEDSVLNRAVKVLTEGMCQDVEVIGWLYQFYIEERREEIFGGFKKKRRAGADEIPAATQLFTPDWIVRYLVDNSLGRLWMLNRPTSRLIDHMSYYVAAVDEHPDFLRITKPEELSVIDPACGSGHMLTYAFDLLYAIYEEEGYSPAEIPGLILSHNLYGIEIDPRAGALAAFALTMKARAKQRTFINKRVEPNVCVIEPITFAPQELDCLATPDGDRDVETAFWTQFARADLLGALIEPSAEVLRTGMATLDSRDAGDEDLLSDAIFARASRVVQQAKLLSAKYAVVVANPPYMGAGNMSSDLSDLLKRAYLREKQDLYACFISRATRLAYHAGVVAMIVGDTWMTIKSFDDFRGDLLKHRAVYSFVHLRDVSLHSDAFGSNAAFAFINRPAAGSHDCLFVRLEPLSDKDKRQRLLDAIRIDDCAWAYHLDVDFTAIPGAPIAYWANPRLVDLYRGPLIGDKFDIKAGVGTRNDDLFMRFHWEVSADRVGHGKRWVLTDKAGEFRKWYAGFIYVMDWENDGYRIKNYRNPDGSLKSRPQNVQYMFREGVTWGKVGAGATSFRWRPAGYGFNDAAPAIFGPGAFDLLAQLNSDIGRQLVEVKGSTLNVQTGMVAELPIVEVQAELADRLRSRSIRAVELSQRDWDTQETSPDFAVSELVAHRAAGQPLSAAFAHLVVTRRETVTEMKSIEAEVNEAMYRAAGLSWDGSPNSQSRSSLLADPAFRFRGRAEADLAALERQEAIIDLVSHAVGCMFGRYAVDKPGLILADQGATLHDYRVQVPSPRFAPDEDNVIPIVDGDWFEDDVVERFRQFLRVAFGQQHFEENLRFVTESLGVRNLRDYFVKSFYDDHVQKYKKRPIYWLFSSANSSFNALIYMHRYTPSTVSTVLNEYLREFQAKLSSSLQQQQALAAGSGTPRQQVAAQKEADRLRKVLLELEAYEHDVLYPLASRQVPIDLDDGVKANYPKFGSALKKIVGLEASDD
jgi:SAM-dependent methyltransferase